MKKIAIPVQYIEDLFNRSCGYMRKLCLANPNVDWSNNDTFYRASAARKDSPIHYTLSGLKYDDYSVMLNKWDFYVLYGMSESFYELGFMLVYDLVVCSRDVVTNDVVRVPRLRLFNRGVVVCEEV